jgi:uncharacterized damage-inducible protein DinB
MSDTTEPQEFEGDLAGAVFWGAELSGATFRDVNLTGVSISHAWVVDVEIDALVERLVVNGVDVTDYVNQHDRWAPLRAGLRPTDVAGVRASYAALVAAWDALVERAADQGDAALHRQVEGEWSIVQTLRHLVFATDKWFTVPVLGRGFAPVGMPNSGSVGGDWPGLDLASSPTTEEVLAVRRERVSAVSSHLGTLTDDALDTTVDVLENGPHTVRDCLLTVIEEEFWHLRYADRDLSR